MASLRIARDGLHIPCRVSSAATAPPQGRIFVIEYKGDDRYDHPKNGAKRAVGELWARKYPNGLYLMPRERDDEGRDIDQQIAHAIAKQ